MCDFILPHHILNSLIKISVKHAFGIIYRDCRVVPAACSHQSLKKSAHSPPSESLLDPDAVIRLLELGDIPNSASSDRTFLTA